MSLRLAAHLRKKFNSHTPTVREIVARMSDELLVKRYHEHLVVNTEYARKATRRKLDYREAGSVTHA